MAEAAVRTIDSLPHDWEAVRLAEIIRQHLPALRQEYGLQSAALFGSYVRNEQRTDSDLDILVTLSRTLSLFGMVGLRDYLSDLLCVPVDVAVRDHLQPRIARYILREALEV